MCDCVMCYNHYIAFTNCQGVNNVMFKLNEIKELIKLVDQSSIEELEIENEATRFRIRKPKPAKQIVNAPVSYQPSVGIVSQQAIEQGGASAQTTQQASASTEQQPEVKDIQNNTATDLHTIASPMVGTFYCSPSPGAPKFVEKGNKVHDKTIVCIVEAMKLMNEIEAEVSGEIVDILVEDGQLVEFGQPLFLVKQG